MIEHMRKVYCVSRSQDRQKLLDALCDLGVVHLLPVKPEQAIADEKLLNQIDRLKRATQVLASLEPEGPPPAMTPEKAANGVLAIQTAQAEKKSRLLALHRKINELAIWGDVRLEDIQTLHEAGVDLEFFAVPPDELQQIRNVEYTQTVGTFENGNRLVAVIGRGSDAELPENAEAVPLPETDMPTVRREAARIDAELKQNQRRLRALSHLTESLKERQTELEEKAAYGVALNGAFSGEDLFAIQGWIPAPQSETLAQGLTAAGVNAAIKTFEPAEDEKPPTLIRYPKWAKPIKGLFDILGTSPAYREFDLSGFFMLAMPLFAAILVGDGGYGLVFIITALLLRKRAQAAGESVKVQLLLILGIVTFVWGILTGSFFGLSPVDLVKAGGMWEGIGKAFNSVVLLGGVSAAELETARDLDTLSEKALDNLRMGLIKTSFILALIHLVAARVREALALAPGQKAIASLGWIACLVGMFGIIWFLFGLTESTTWLNSCFGIVGAGFVVAVLFTFPHKNPFKRLGIGFAASLFPLMGTFSDMMSYIRLMAVSMASVYIGLVFNMMGSQLASVATWILGAPVVLFGHGMNIGLCVIAIFAHGVRLNMLEFSNNAGVQWGGYPFVPFARKKRRRAD
ncbi:MAG: V-type ATP synthase subunit I [Planctomycetota bacterium]